MTDAPTLRASRCSRAAWQRGLARFVREIRGRCPHWFEHHALGVVAPALPEWAEQAAAHHGVRLRSVAASAQAVDALFQLRCGAPPEALDPDEFEPQPEPETDWDTRVAAMEQRSLPAGEGRPALHWRACGSGSRCVVVWNALGQAAELLRGPLVGLPDEMRVLTWELRDRMDPDPHRTEEIPAFDDHETDLDRILEAERVERADFVGWCTGGKAILRYAARRPRLARSLTIFNGAFRHAGDPSGWATPWERGMAELAAPLLGSPHLAELAASALRRFDARAALTATRMAAEAVACAEEALDLIPRGAEVLVRRTWATGPSTSRYLRAVQDFWRAAVPSELGALRCPVHFVSASRDRVADPAFAERLRQRIPGASHLLVVGANHYLPWESPALAAGLLRALLDDRDPAGRGHPEIARYSGQEAP